MSTRLTSDFVVLCATVSTSSELNCDLVVLLQLNPRLASRFLI
ncbi:hypothetical protein MKZ21_12430 [Paenibacillus sp. FSL P2-0536]